MPSPLRTDLQRLCCDHLQVETMIRTSTITPILPAALKSEFRQLIAEATGDLQNPYRLAPRREG